MRATATVSNDKLTQNNISSRKNGRRNKGRPYNCESNLDRLDNNKEEIQADIKKYLDNVFK